MAVYEKRQKAPLCFQDFYCKCVLRKNKSKNIRFQATVLCNVFTEHMTHSSRFIIHHAVLQLAPDRVGVRSEMPGGKMY